MERNKFPLQGSGLRRFPGSLSCEKGSKQFSLALIRKIDVRMWEIKSPSKRHATGSRRDVKAGGEWETSVKSLLLLHCNDENRGGEEGGGGERGHSCLLLC